MSYILLFLVEGSPATCSEDCACINHCSDGEIGLCNNNSYDCESCEDDSSDSGSDSDVGECCELYVVFFILFLVDSSPNHCSKDCDCINHCVDGEIGLCNNNSCECESCEDESSDGDSDSDAEDGGEF